MRKLDATPLLPEFFFLSYIVHCILLVINERNTLVLIFKYQQLFFFGKFHFGNTARDRRKEICK